MPFKPGNGKPERSGRKAGTPNRSTERLTALLQEHGIDPAVKLCEILPTLEGTKQADILLKLMEYIYPKRKAVEVAGEDGAPLMGTRPQTEQSIEERALKIMRLRSERFGDEKSMTFGRVLTLLEAHDAHVPKSNSETKDVGEKGT